MGEEREVDGERERQGKREGKRWRGGDERKTKVRKRGGASMEGRGMGGKQWRKGRGIKVSTSAISFRLASSSHPPEDVSSGCLMPSEDRGES